MKKQFFFLNSNFFLLFWNKGFGWGKDGAFYGVFLGFMFSVALEQRGGFYLLWRAWKKGKKHESLYYVLLELC